jgi:hypothetical protein
LIIVGVEAPARHGARRAYREYASNEQRSPAECIGVMMISSSRPGL